MKTQTTALLLLLLIAALFISGLGILFYFALWILK